MGFQEPVTTRAKTRTSTRFAPARSKARAAALSVAPDGHHVVDKNDGASLDDEPRLFRHGEAPCTLVARWARDEADLRRGRFDASEHKRIDRLAAGARDRRAASALA